MRAPSGMFARRDRLANQDQLDQPGPVITTQHLEGVAITLPRVEQGRTPVVLRAWYLPAIVVSSDCSLDRQPDQVLVAPVLPLVLFAEEQRHGVRQDTFLTALHLPADHLELADGTTAHWPESVVDFTRTVPVAPHLLDGERMVALSDALADRFREAWVRFIAGREISSTGTIEAARGRTVVDVEVLESSKQRHTVLLTFDDDAVLVLYQEPRHRNLNVQVVEVTAGLFSRTDLQGVAGTNLVIRFENRDARPWHATCRSLGHDARLLQAGATTPVLIRCPDQPGDHTLFNADKRVPGASLTVHVVPPGR